MRPFADEPSLFAAADRCWQHLPEADWLEAFRSHPALEKSMRRIRPRLPQRRGRAEQSQMKEADAAILLRMQQGHREYEERFGRIFIVCASGKQPAEMLQILERRLSNDPAEELLESAAQQQQIMQLRLRKWLAGRGLREPHLHPCTRYRAGRPGCRHDGASGIRRASGNGKHLARTRPMAMAAAPTFCRRMQIGLQPGQYRLRFETGTYHAAQMVKGLYLTVEIIVTVRPAIPICTFHYS